MNEVFNMKHIQYTCTHRSTENVLPLTPPPLPILTYVCISFFVEPQNTFQMQQFHCSVSMIKNKRIKYFSMVFFSSCTVPRVLMNSLKTRVLNFAIALFLCVHEIFGLMIQKQIVRSLLYQFPMFNVKYYTTYNIKNDDYFTT